MWLSFSRAQSQNSKNETDAFILRSAPCDADPHLCGGRHGRRSQSAPASRPAHYDGDKTHARGGRRRTLRSPDLCSRCTRASPRSLAAMLASSRTLSTKSAQNQCPKPTKPKLHKKKNYKNNTAHTSKYTNKNTRKNCARERERKKLQKNCGIKNTNKNCTKKNKKGYKKTTCKTRNGT